MTIRDSLAAELNRNGHPWLTFLLPFLVYMVVGSFEPSPPRLRDRLSKASHRPTDAAAPPPTLIEADNWFGLATSITRSYTRVKIALTIAAMLYVLPGYRQFPFRISPLAIVVGVVGVVLWIWLCHLHLERSCSTAIGLEKPGRPRSTAGVQSTRTTGRDASLGLHVPGDPVPGPRARRADHRRVLPPRLRDAIRRARRLVGRAIRRSDAARRGRRHGWFPC